MSRLICLFLACLCSIASYSQSYLNYKLSNIPVVTNIDSLADEVNRKPTLKSLLILSKTATKYGVPLIKSNSNLIDTIALKTNNEYLKSLNRLFKVYEQVDLNKNLNAAFAECNNLIPQFTALQDTTALIEVYYLLVKLHFQSADFAAYPLKNLEAYVTKSEQLAMASNKVENQLEFLLIKTIYQRWIHREIDGEILFNQAVDLIEKNPEYYYYYHHFVLRVCFYICIRKKDPSRSYELLAAVFNDIAKYNNSLSYMKYLFNIASNLGYVNDWQSSLHYSKKALELANIRNTSDLGFIWNCNNQIVESFYKLKMLDSAWEYQQLANKTFRKQITEENNENLREIVEKYHVQERENENKQLLQKQKNYTIFIIVATFFLIIIALLFIKTNNQRKKLKVLNDFKERIYAIISHDLRSPLYALQDLYGQVTYLIKTNNLNDLKTITTQIDEVSNNISSLLSNLFFWAKNTNTKAHKIVSNFQLKAQINDTIKLYKNIIESKNVVLENKICGAVVVSANANVLDLIVRNWIDNVLKYSQANVIEINTTSCNNNVYLNIVDDGTMQAEVLAKIKAQISDKQLDIKLNNANGLGLSFMAYFAKEVGWQLNLANTNGKTVFTIDMHHSTHYIH